jgi:hypothetical protein
VEADALEIALLLGRFCSVWRMVSISGDYVMILSKSEPPRLVHSICYPKVALIRNTSTSRSTSGV